MLLALLVVTASPAIIYIFLELLCYEVASTAYYFHEPSHFELTSPNGDKDFGFSLDYQMKMNNLVVGAPKSDLHGKVFKCPLTDITTSTQTNITCSQANIDIDQLAGDFRKISTGLPDHPCHLGASLATTDDYIFTCAPLCSKYLELRDKSKALGAYGTCFVYDGQNAKRYHGLLETYEQNKSNQSINLPEVDNFMGGVGWTTFSDPTNKLIIIAKSIGVSCITFLDMDDPLQPVKKNDILKNGLSIFTNGGVAFAAGTFFNDKKYYYAFSMKKKKHGGGIAFMYYNKQHRNNIKSLEILRDESNTRPLLIRDDHSISMYGTALHSADLNNDNFSELIVGAPAFSTPGSDYELGAIYLYKGGGKLLERKTPTLCIMATKDAARFGTSIASTDLDGDGMAEIFVSAPYLEKEGAVYILLGNEIRKLLDRSNTELKRDTLLSSLKHTQTLQIKNFETFGYSLHAFERNGTHFLAVGSPSTGKVAIYRGLSLVRVTMSLRVLGDKSIREQDKSFTVIVKVKLENSRKSLNSTIKLFLSSEVTGDEVNIQGNTTNKIELSKTKPESTSNVVVLLGKDGPGDYKFTARVYDKEPFKQKDYDTSSVQLTPQSETISVLEVPRHCKGNDCVPKFLTNFIWSGGSKKYILGSSESEDMLLLINNEGSSTYDSCAWIKVTGAQIAVLECNRPDDGIWYKCPLRIENNSTHSIYIRLDMSHPTNKDKTLNFEVHLFNHCASFNSNATNIVNKEITYIFNNKDIEIEGSSFDRNFTDSEMYSDAVNAITNIHESYKITNRGNISWYQVLAVLKYQDLSFVKEYEIYGKDNCEKNITNGFVEIKCVIDIDPKSTKFIHSTAILSKSKFIKHLKNRKFVLNSTLELHFDSADSKFANYTTTIFVQIDAQLWENQYVLVGVAVIGGVFIMGTIVIILYKIGFFKRKGKKKTKGLRDSIRKGTFRRPSTAADVSDSKVEAQDVQT